MKSKAILFGPFFGEVSWEYFRFSPYVIYLKKTNPDSLVVVLTREDRFDFYGQWADILVPLRIKDEHIYTQEAFKLLGYDVEMCKRITEMFVDRYKEQFRIKDHYIPDISSLRYKLKWQYPRDKMDYDFRPRRANFSVVKEIVNEKNVIIVDGDYFYSSDKYDIIDMKSFKETVKKIIDEGHKVSYYGCLIELIKQCKFVVSDLQSDIGRLSILLRTPLIYPNRGISTDAVMLLNPEKTLIIDCENVEDGVEIYENNI